MGQRRLQLFGHKGNTENNRDLVWKVVAQVAEQLEHSEEATYMDDIYFRLTHCSTDSVLLDMPVEENLGSNHHAPAVAREDNRSDQVVVVGQEQHSWLETRPSLS